MDVKLKDFLTSINLNNDEINLFDNATLTSATYITTSKKFIINISFNSLCKPEVYFVVDKIRNIKTYDFNINIIQHDTLINSTYITQIFQNVIIPKYKNIAMIQSIKNIEIDIINSKITFLFSSEVQRDSFLTYKRDFQNIFNTLGINRILDFSISKINASDIHKEFQNEVNNIVNSMYVEEPKPTQNYNKVKRDLSNSEDVEISTLTQDDKNVTVNGKIFAMEDKTYNNRLIMSYYRL